MKQKQEAALKALTQARALVEQLDGVLADATLILEEDGGYTQHGMGDVCGPLWACINSLEQDVKSYVTAP